MVHSQPPRHKIYPAAISLPDADVQISEIWLRHHARPGLSKDPLPRPLQRFSPSLDTTRAGATREVVPERVQSRAAAPTNADRVPELQGQAQAAT